jgi:hypothetical protein
MKRLDLPAAEGRCAPARVELQVERVVLRGAAAEVLPASNRPAFARQLAAELQRVLQQPGAAARLGAQPSRQRLRADDDLALHAPDAACRLAAAIAAALTGGGRR